MAGDSFFISAVSNYTELQITALAAYILRISTNKLIRFYFQ